MTTTHTLVNVTFKDPDPTRTVVMQRWFVLPMLSVGVELCVEKTGTLIRLDRVMYNPFKASTPTGRSGVQQVFGVLSGTNVSDRSRFEQSGWTVVPRL